MRRALALSAVLLGPLACSLDPSGANPGTGGSGTGSTVTSSSATGNPTSTGSGASTAATTTGNSGSSSSGDGGAGAGGASTASASGGGASTASAGGGGASTTSTGGGGTGGTGGAGGATGSGGAGGSTGAGGGNTQGEFLVRVHGGGNQEVRDVAYDDAGAYLYAVGVVEGNNVLVNDVDLHDADGRDGFVMKVDALTGAVEWFTAFGGTGNDEAKSVAVSSDGRVFIAGAAENTNGTGDVFASFPVIPGASPFAFLVEVDAATGALGVGTSFGQVTTAEDVDVAVTSTQVIAVGTCNNCAGGMGRDLQLLTWDLTSGGIGARSIVSAGDQFGTAIATQPGVDGFTLVGEKASGTFVATLGVTAACQVTSDQNVDVFAVSYLYDVVNADYDCQWASALGSSNNDVAEDAHMDEAGNVYVAATFPNDFGNPPTPGPAVARLEALTGIMLWSVNMGTTSQDTFALGGDALTMIAGGRAQSAYGVDIDRLTGSVGTYRTFTGTVETRGVDAAGDARVAGGWWSGSAEFGGTFPTQAASGRDAFVVRYLAP